jgi:hypothetical protein
MKTKLCGSAVEAVPVVAIAVALFYRWTEYKCYGDFEHIEARICFGLVFSLFLFLPVLAVVYRGARRSGVKRISVALIADLYAIVICALFAVGLGEDLSRFRILGGTGSKEMQQLSANEGVQPEDLAQWHRDIHASISRECYLVVLMLALLLVSALREYKFDCITQECGCPGGLRSEQTD